jgi:hypothetical protein
MSLCTSLPNSFRTNYRIFMKLDRMGMPFSLHLKSIATLSPEIVRRSTAGVIRSLTFSCAFCHSMLGAVLYQCNEWMGQYHAHEAEKDYCYC